VIPPKRVIDLFAGAGGLSAGFAQVRTSADSPAYRMVGAVEDDTAAAASYSSNFPDAVLFAGPIEAWFEVHEADVIVGGPPCQGFSQLGRQDEEDPRNRLWEEYFRVVEKIRPQAFVLENVDRFRSSVQFSAFAARCVEAGYPQLHVATLNAADFGTPQTRLRTIVVGIEERLPALQPLPSPTHARSPSLEATVAWRTVADVLHCLDGRAPRTTALPVDRIVTVERSDAEIRNVSGPFSTDELHVGRRPTALSLERYRHIGPGENRHALPDHLQAPCWRKHKTGAADVMGRLRWDRPSVTIRTEFFKPEKGRYLHPSEDRAITHLEAALLQGFPRDYRWCGSKVDIARQIGNAVPVPLAEAVGRGLYEALLSV
jgi:DNA (cytosine-5)-methyltransferase 1